MSHYTTNASPVPISDPLALLCDQLANYRTSHGKTPKKLRVTATLFRGLSERFRFMPGHRCSAEKIVVALGDERVEIYPQEESKCIR